MVVHANCYLSLAIMTAVSAVKYATAVTLICVLSKSGSWAQDCRDYFQGDDVTSKKPCMDKLQCINATSLCDGITDCADGSDETLISCASFPCSQPMFRCDYGACINSDLKCNNINNCADGSDEDPLLCGRPGPEPSTERLRRRVRSPAKLTPGRTTSRPISCQVPPQPKHGRWKLHKSLCDGGNCETYRGSALEPGTRLVYECSRGYRLKGGTNVYCERDGSWSSLPVCVEAKCTVLNSASRMATCTTRLGNSISCDSLAATGTRAQVKCRAGYREDTNPITAQREIVSCNQNGEWEPNPIKCVPGPFTIYVEVEEGVIKVRAQVAENSTTVNLVDVTNDKVIVYTGQSGNSEKEPNIDVRLNLPRNRDNISEQLVESWTWPRRESSGN